MDDVAECVRAAVFESVHAGKTYELSGPGKIKDFVLILCRVRFRERCTERPLAVALG